MPSQIDNAIADSTSNSLFTSCDDKERSLTMSITQSKSFESTQMSNVVMDGPELTISLSASSDSIGFDENCTDLSLKDSFGNETHNEPSEGKDGDHQSFDGNCEVSVVSAGGAKGGAEGAFGTGDANSTASAASARPSKNGNANNTGSNSTSASNSKSFGTQVLPPGPPPHGYHVQPLSHYAPVSGPGPAHPHYQRQYYPNPNANGAPPTHPHPSAPQYSAQAPQQYDHRFPQPSGPPGSYNSNSRHPAFAAGMQYQHSGYHFAPHSGYPPHAYRHGPHPPPPPPPSQQSQPSSSSHGPSNARHFIQNSNSSVMSVSSHGSSRKRTIDGMMEEDAKSATGGFTKHRCSSNSSTCSTATAGNNTTTDTINTMICESPMKRERLSSPEKGNDRRVPSESGASALSFSGLSMGANETGRL